MDIYYTNQTGNTNSIDNNPQANWSQSFEGTKGSSYSLSVNGEPTGSFTLTTRIYYNGDLQEEQVKTSYYDNNSNSWNYLSSSLYYRIPNE